MSFEEAIYEAKHGSSVGRMNGNWLVFASCKEPVLLIEPVGHLVAPICAWYVPTQEDMFADDWSIV